MSRGGKQQSEVFVAIQERYTPAYKAAQRLYAFGIAFFLLSCVAALALVFASEFNRGAVLISIGIGLVGGFVISLFAIASSLMRAFVDKAVFSTPGLSDQEKLDVAFQASEETPPTIIDGSAGYMEAHGNESSGSADGPENPGDSELDRALSSLGYVQLHVTGRAECHLCMKSGEKSELYYNTRSHRYVHPSCFESKKMQE